MPSVFGRGALVKARALRFILDGLLTVCNNAGYGYGMETTEIAWAAGFLDGEGSFTLRGKSPRIDITQKVIEPLEYFRNIFSVGNIYSSSVLTPSGKPTTRHHFVATGVDAMSILSLILPYLVLKKESAATLFHEGQSRRKWKRKRLT